MVQLTPHEEAALRRDGYIKKDPLNVFDRKIVGHASRRIDIPTDTPEHMGLYVDELEALVTRLRALATLNVTLRQYMFMYQEEIMNTQYRIRQIKQGGFKLSAIEGGKR